MIDSDGTTCIGCGATFHRGHPYRGNYCSECRSTPAGGETDG